MMARTHEEKNMPSPIDLMRARRPHLFSDSRIEDVIDFPRASFEYHLDTLTNRKQEYEFEHFCRKLAEREICPNLRVQTGPTGGGDSKVDSETYPVAPEISERWWIGTPAAGTERWAFAFSAKKDWKRKVKADIESIVSTDRQYDLIYFITNQFARDKDRADLEDTLSKTADVPVRIMDRSWIVEKVYQSGLLETALSTLNIDAVRVESSNTLGPLDFARLEELRNLDERVSDVSQYSGTRYQLVEDCLRGAILARGLERPRNEVEGRFLQADRLARALDYHPQRLRIAYNRAWTAHWWFEDFSDFSTYYDEVEKYAKNSSEAPEVELLLNLWLLLPPAVVSKRITQQKARVESRAQTLSAMFEAMESNRARPNNALQARTGLTLMKIVQAHHLDQVEVAESLWVDLKDIAVQSSAFPFYPIERLFDLISELGNYLESTAFDELYEELVEIIRERRSDGDAGSAYAERGMQKLRQRKPYEAIKWFGRAEALLAKEEYRHSLVMTLVGASYAYERTGLFWAARSKALAAVERALATVTEDGEVGAVGLLCAKRLLWIELQIGRIPELMQLFEFQNAIASQAILSEAQSKSYEDERITQEGVLGIHLLNMPFTSLASVVRLPDVLDDLDLFGARMALLYVLGHEDKLRSEGYIPSEETAEAVFSMFEKWHNQPATDDIPTSPILLEGEWSLLRSIVLGVEIEMVVATNPISIGIAESLLGSLEAFLSTSVDESVYAYSEKLVIEVRPNGRERDGFEVSFSPDDRRKGKIVHPENLQFTDVNEQKEFGEWQCRTLLELVSRMLVPRDATTWIENVAEAEQGLSRALMFGDTFTLSKNIFGDARRVTLGHWIRDHCQEFSVLRKEAWHGKEEMVDEREELGLPKFGEGAPPDELLSSEQLKHSDYQVLSPIDIEEWNQAGWTATVFAWRQGDLPMLCIGFLHGDRGKLIFKRWRNTYGEEDTKDEIRIAIITGINKDAPHEYAVVVGGNLRRANRGGGKRITVVSRINRMTPTSSDNLDNFRAQYDENGGFLLAPAEIRGGNPELFPELVIRKHHVAFRQAWQIGEHDPDISVLKVGDKPVIPEGLSDAPVVRALDKIRSREEC